MPLSCFGAMVGLGRIVHEVNKLEQKIQELSDSALRTKTEEFKGHIAQKSKGLQKEIDELQALLDSVSIPEEKDKIKEKLKFTRNKVFEEILPQAFAVVREASRRTIGLRHFDVQIAGGMVLHEGKIAEMATGEGKTLVATLPAYLNALLGKGVHIITVNDYLAKRDSEWMGPIYQFLGLTVGVIQHDMSDAERQLAYGCDITYGTNNEFGFDYLRDNMKYRLEDLVQRQFYFAIVDEVDSILVDEARTPLIISGATEESTDKYYTARRLADQLKGKRITESEEIDAKYKGQDLSRGFDYIADEKANTISLTEEGETKAARLWGVDNLHSMETMEHKHHIIQALRAKEYFKRDTEYIVKDGQVIIVDEFTGRLMPGRRWSDGLHQAIEAKEGLKIEQENQTLATITFQNYFRMYEKLAGMTGTAFTEANEFKAIYKLDVVVVPANRPIVRTNYPDCVYKTEKEKLNAVVEEIVEFYNRDRPVLVGTTSVAKNLKLSELLKKRNIPHAVLNAEKHEEEAKIIAEAGREKRVTVATNMAGRGIDIILGGEPQKLKRAILATIICQDSLKYVSSIIGDFKSPKAQFDELTEKIFKVKKLHEEVYHKFIDDDATMAKDFLINFDKDYAYFNNTFLNNATKLKEAIVQEQKYLEEIFFIVEIGIDHLKNIDKFLEKCKSKLQSLESLFYHTKQSIQDFMDFLRKERQGFEDTIKSIANKEKDIRDELGIVSGLQKEEQKEEESKSKGISEEELGKLYRRLEESEDKLDKIYRDSNTSQEKFLEITEYTKKLKDFEILAKKSGPQTFDLEQKKKDLFLKWRPLAYDRSLGNVRTKIDDLGNIVRNQFQKELSLVEDELETKKVLENISVFLKEFNEIYQDLQKVNLLVKEKIISKDLTAIKNISALSPGSRIKMGILSEDLEVYAKEHEKIVGLGGLHVIGTERHEARRIDNQLRGRSGRQGDPGSSRFYVSFQDELMRLFAPDWILKMLDTIDTDGQPLTLKEGNLANMISKSIETAQKRVEQHNFEIRKQLLEYDNVMNKQREVIYGQRRAILEGLSLKEDVLAMVERIIADTVSLHFKENAQEASDESFQEIASAISLKFALELDINMLKGKSREALKQDLYNCAIQCYEEKEQVLGQEVVRNLERMVFLQIVDSKWKDHLYAMDKLREGIGLRAYGHRDPLIEYKNEAFSCFREMIANIEEESVEMIFKLQPARQERLRGVFSSGEQEFLHPEVQRPKDSRQSTELSESQTARPRENRTPAKLAHPKVGRNDLCPCG
jgi:preprotein translocase subunit SecA